MPPKDAKKCGELYVEDLATGEMKKLGDVAEFTASVSDDRINDNVIDPKENRWFSKGGTITFGVKAPVIIDSSATEVL